MVKYIKRAGLTLLTAAVCVYVTAQQPVYKSEAFTVFPDKIVQGKFEATALSERSMQSNYQSPANLYQSSDISFKFSLNGGDNEMISGKDHHFTVIVENGIAQTPIIKFGQQLNQLSDKKGFLAPNTKFKVRLDLRDVLQQFKEHGFFTCFNGQKIYKDDFKGVYIAGGTLPMIWDFDNLHHHTGLQLTDTDGDGIYETTLVLNSAQDRKQIESSWKQTKDATAFPQYHSEYLLSNAIYNLSIEEMINAVEPDSTFRTGKEWAGVWTRDISYSILLSMAYLQPQVAKYSLLRKVNSRKRIIQDTGTGGAYPASTDRMVWAIAAWEVYKATGDKEWLEKAYEIIHLSITDDIENAYDSKTGMVKGESSFLDWREQTYPKWMKPADIYESENLGTNAVHYQANIVASNMAAILGKNEEATTHTQLASHIKNGINKYLWMEDKGYYAQFLYGNLFKMPSPKSEALGEALCILFGIADQQRAERVVASVPVTPFGISCVYPQIPDIAPYHNNAVWPFVQSYWALAAAKAGNETAVLSSIADIYRPAGLFLTNKENFVADNGDFAGTVINSSNMLWSLSGNISLVHKILFGIEYMPNQLLFHPFVPDALKGLHRLTNFKYRNAVLDISIEGSGNQIASFVIDDKSSTDPVVNENLEGNHRIVIKLKHTPTSGNQINSVKNYTTLDVPVIKFEKSGILSWSLIDGAVKYDVYKNGKKFRTVHETNCKIKPAVYAEYRVVAIDKEGVPSFASLPLTMYTSNTVKKMEVEDFAAKSNLTYPGYSGTGFVETSKTINTIIKIPFTANEKGVYAIYFKYANGNGPVNTENKCAIRTLKINNKKVGTIVLPQRGTNEWSNWGFSNPVEVTLDKGESVITLSLEAYNENMNGVINQAMIDEMQVIKLK